MSDNLFSFSGRVALVTGGGSGLGSYIAKGLVEAGASRVYITGRRAPALQGIAETAPDRIIPIVGDVATIEGCRRVTGDFIAGEKNAGVVEKDVKLDMLVNNAGVGLAEGTWGAEATLEEIRDALLTARDVDWAQEFAVNAGSIQWMSACVLPYLVRAAKTNEGFREGRGCIVNNTSVSAFYYKGQGHLYAASKAAAHSVTQSLADKLTRLGVRVNSIAPANVPSEMNDPSNPQSFISRLKDVIPIGRIGEAQDVVGTVLYLGSRAGSFVSGTVIAIDGGILLAH
ncbi:uncharacterized protein FIBRA_00358 [Fibroporia radiculosa]|uniref:NAD(P)-binding protein n=1 Tax=Fibroporia radiculosa TaxID=599839 RepID=J7SCR9_9APHY|nr:uncharacterized protein FIBRA_00358 [Fibroporia radiculosa]CCL98363.1 predicted protein [Fibroporia radiculosa]